MSDYAPVPHYLMDRGGLTFAEEMAFAEETLAETSMLGPIGLAAGIVGLGGYALYKS